MTGDTGGALLCLPPSGSAGTFYARTRRDVPYDRAAYHPLIGVSDVRTFRPREAAEMKGEHGHWGAMARPGGGHEWHNLRTSRESQQ